MSRINGNEHNDNGFPKSFILHSLLLLFAFFYSFKANVEDKDPDKPYKVVMEMDFRQEVVKRTPPPPPPPKLADFEEESSNSTKADADKGESRPINPEVQKVKVNDPKPPAPTPTPTPTPVKTTPVVKPTPPSRTPISTKDESPVKVKENPIDIENATKDDVPVRAKPNTAPSTNTSTSNGSPAPKPGAGTVGSPTGTSNKPQSNTDGNGQGKSDSGPGRGSTTGTDVTSGTGNSSDGTGEFDGSGNGIFKRKVRYKNWANIPMTVSGKVSIKSCINQAGLVTYTEIIQFETTIKDKKVLKDCLKAAKGYKYDPDTKAPKEQCGKIIFNLDINRFK